MSAEERCEQIFQAIDRDGSQSIDKDEFEVYFNQFKSLVTVEGTSAEVFALIDTNGDGNLSKEELKNFIASRLNK